MDSLEELTELSNKKREEEKKALLKRRKEGIRSALCSLGLSSIFKRKLLGETVNLLLEICPEAEAYKPRFYDRELWITVRSSGGHDKHLASLKEVAEYIKENRKE